MAKPPKANRFRPRDRFVYLAQSVRSIQRNKRRSISMISGLILGISILAGIFLYTTVLMNNVYLSIIEGSPYEIRMDFDDPLSDGQIDDFKDNFSSHVKIADSQVLFGNGRTIFDSTSGTIYASAILRAEIRVEYSNENYTGSEGRIFNSDFYYSPIGESLRKSLVTGREANIFVGTHQNYHGILISEALAEKAKLREGNRLSALTLKITIPDPTDPGFPFSEGELKGTAVLEDVIIAGIMSKGDEASAGLFSEEMITGTGGGEIFIPRELFGDRGNFTSFFNILNEEQMQYCVLKIDEDQFSISDPTRVNSQINALINEFEKDPDLIGSNLVQNQLLPFQLLSIFIFIFDGILTLPVAILSIYLLSFGIDLSLQERRYQVGILKTQGASPKQIKRKILTEALFLAILGLIVGYAVAIFGAWGIGTATGFMSWDWDYALDKFPDFVVLDQTALFVVGGFIAIILILMVNGKSNKFIEMEISETVRRTDVSEKGGFLRRNNLDIVFFILGAGSLALNFLSDFGLSINLGPLGPILAIIGPILFWIGGAAVVARIAIWIPSKTDPIIKRIGFLKDVSILIKGNIFRKSGDIPRLALIIALTVSFSVLAAVQGTSGQIHQERLIVYDIGADMVVNTGFNLTSLVIPSLNSTDGVEEVMAITTTNGIIRNDEIFVHSVDSSVYGSVAKWQVDAISGSGKKDQMLYDLSEHAQTGCLIGESVQRQYDYSMGDTVQLEILGFSFNGTAINYGYIEQNLTIYGIYHHTPGGIGSGAVIIDHELINSLANLPTATDPKDVFASKYLVQVSDDYNDDEVAELRETLLVRDYIVSIKTLRSEIDKAKEIKQMDFGIPGLLTADFIISLLTATLATFIFMSILMEKRKKEFAVLRSYGASERQIFKIVFSETIVLLLTAVLWGLLVGLGLSVLFNPFFETLDIFITPISAISGAGSELNRLLVFDWWSLGFTLFVTFLAMMLSTFFSVRGAARAKISTVVREL
ncbi:MAG: ABC transporter permease [Candidatus Hodarchaeales archaeon]|jgi:ABC-type lipoprotein release transport system permease subunit